MKIKELVQQMHFIWLVLCKEKEIKLILVHVIIMATILRSSLNQMKIRMKVTVVIPVTAVENKTM